VVTGGASRSERRARSGAGAFLTSAFATTVWACEGKSRARGTTPVLRVATEAATATPVATLAARLPASAVLLEGLLERARQRATCAEDERLDRRLRDLQLRGDLPVGEALPLAQEDGMALLLGEAGERVVEPEELVAGGLGSGDGVLHRLEILRPLVPRAPVRRAAPGEADVVRDREEPRLGDIRLEPVVQAAAGVQVGRLHGVLGLFARAQLAQAVRVDSAVMLVEELFRELRSRGHPRSLEEGYRPVVPRKGQATSRQSSMRMSKLSPPSCSTVHVSSST